MDIRNLLYDFEQAIRKSQNQINNGLPRWSADLPGDRIKQQIAEYVDQLQEENQQLSNIGSELNDVRGQLYDANKEIEDLEYELYKANAEIDTLEGQLHAEQSNG